MSSEATQRTRMVHTSDESVAEQWQAWIIPVLLLFETVFVGSTFDTLSSTFAGGIAAALIVVILLSRQKRDGEMSELAEPNRDARRLARKDFAGSQRPLAGPRQPVGKHSSTTVLKQSFDRARLLKRSYYAIPIAAIVAAVGVSARVSHHMSGNVNPIAMLVDSAAHLSLWASLTLWVFFPRRGHPAMLGFGVLLVLMTVTAGGVSHSISGQLVAALATVLAFSLASHHVLGHWQIVSSLRLLRRKRRRREKRRSKFAGSFRTDQAPLPGATVSTLTSGSRSWLMFTVLAMSLLLMTTSALGHLASVVVPGLQLELFDQLSKTLESVTSNSMIGGSRYVSGSRLGSVRKHMVGDPSETAVRAFADSAPGYLRGTAFDSYYNARWDTKTESSYRGPYDPSVFRERELTEMEAREVTLAESTVELNRVTLRSASSDDLVGTIEVHNVPMKGSIVFTSMTTQWMDAVSRTVMASNHDIITGGVDITNPYLLGVGERNPPESLAPAQKDVLLAVPGRLRPTLENITRDVCRDRLTARSKAAAIEKYFEDNYKYSLEDHAAQTQRRIDPIQHFLITQHPAHCEFFATAAALMLRTVDVPTRYITGYVMDEKSDESDDEEYWIARNRDAHAWVEAYDEITEQWFPVEATKGRTYRTLQSQDAERESEDTGTSGLDDTEEERSFIDRFVGWIASFRTADSLTFLFRIAQLPLFCMLVILLWLRHRQKVRGGGDPDEYASRQMLLRVDRRLRKHQLVRAPHETLHQFARRIDHRVDDGEPTQEHDAFLSRAASWYRDFASARYQGQLPEPMPENV